MKQANKYWRYVENVVFIYAFYLILTRDWIKPFFDSLWKTITGKEGLITGFQEQFNKGQYTEAFLIILWEIIIVFTLWEIGKVLYEAFKSEKNKP